MNDRTNHLQRCRTTQSTTASTSAAIRLMDIPNQSPAPRTRNPGGRLPAGAPCVYENRTP